MRQYAFPVELNGKRDTVYVTAPKASWACLQVMVKYAGWRVGEVDTVTRDPHTILTEIDASDMTAEDADYLVRKLKERVDA